MERLVFDDRVEYRFGDKLHRVDGPAVEDVKGTKSWWREGRLHRTDGPAIMWSNGSFICLLNNSIVTRQKIEESYRKKLINSLLLARFLRRPELQMVIEKTML
jgi:hypothetical protein